MAMEIAPQGWWSDAGSRSLLGEGQDLPILRHIHLDGLVLLQVAPQEGLGQRIFKMLLDSAPQRPRPEFFIVSLVDEEILRRIGKAACAARRAAT